MRVFIKENSWIARIAAAKLHTSSCAIVLGKTIYLYNVSRSIFLQNTTWLRHEIAHVYQWHQSSYIVFVFKYLLFSIRYGYYNNPYEVAARHAEANEIILNEIEIMP